MVTSPLGVCLQLAVVGAVLAPASVTGFGFDAGAGGVGGYQPGAASGGIRQMIMNMWMQRYGGGGYGYGTGAGGYGYGAQTGGYGGGYGTGGYDQYNSGGYYRRRVEETSSNEDSGPDDASPVDSDADAIPDSQGDLSQDADDQNDLGTPVAIDNDVITTQDQVNTDLLQDAESSSQGGSSPSESNANRSNDPEEPQDDQVRRRLRKV